MRRIPGLSKGKGILAIRDTRQKQSIRLAATSILQLVQQGDFFLEMVVDGHHFWVAPKFVMVIC